MSLRKITSTKYHCSRIDDYVSIEKRYTKLPSKPQQCQSSCRDSYGCSRSDCIFVGGNKNYLDDLFK